MATKQCVLVLVTLLGFVFAAIIPLQISTITVSFTPSSMLLQGTTSPIPFTSIRLHIQVSITPLGPSSPGSLSLSPFCPPPPNPSIYESPPSVPSPPPPASPSQTPPSPSTPSSSF
ncbi:hypothetical protein M0R45_017092 [Rubus argutus]|uniref:Uncharacterized protein n=1 Tax=Rubus argutus TaxID=59490 RepID=A0AAW1XUM2_RUBAR